MEKELIKYHLPQVYLNVLSVTYSPEMLFLRSHYHGAVELVCVHSGKITCHVGDSVFSLSANDTLLINKNVVHNIECSDYGTKFSYMQIEIDKHFASAKKEDTYYIYQFIDKPSPVQYNVSKKNSELYILFANIFNEFHSNKSYSNLYLQSYILQLIAFMHKHEMIKEFDSRFLKKLESIKPVIQFIDNHFTDKIYIENLASILNFNKFQLCRYFKAITGGTVVEYINFLRLQHATELLLNSNRNITEIAFSCGFSSVQYFNKVFKQNFGIPPKKYRSTSHLV